MPLSTSPTLAAFHHAIPKAKENGETEEVIDDAPTRLCNHGIYLGRQESRLHNRRVGMGGELALYFFFPFNRA
ncbi:MAG: hypothetical protein AB7S52_07250 [Sphaerochaetaceae bacterium]